MTKSLKRCVEFIEETSGETTKGYEIRQALESSLHLGIWVEERLVLRREDELAKGS